MRQRVKPIKFLTQFILFWVFVSSAVHAEDGGYSEAMEYFKHRKLASEKTSKTQKKEKPFKAPVKFKKNVLSLGFVTSNISDSGERSSGGHISYITKTHPLLRQSLSLEYEALRDLDKFSFFQSLYYDRYKKWGPEFAFGAGRLFGDEGEEEDLAGSFVALKLGISLVDRMGGLLDIRVFFKQEVYFKKSLQSEGVGVSLYLKM